MLLLPLLLLLLLITIISGQINKPATDKSTSSANETNPPLSEVSRQLHEDPFNYALAQTCRRLRRQQQEQDRYAFTALIRGLRAARANQPAIAAKWLTITRDSARVQAIYNDFISRNLNQFIAAAHLAAAQSDCPECAGLREQICKQCRGAGWTVCPRCRGIGRLALPGTPLQTCPACDGRGLLDCTVCDETGFVPCAACQSAWLTPELLDEIDRLLALTRHLPSLEALEFTHSH